MTDGDDSNVTTLHPKRDNPTGDKRKRRTQRLTQGPVSGARNITAEQKAALAIELRLRGYTLQQVADEVGYTDPSAAYKAVMRGLRAELPEDQRDQLRRIEVAKLNEIERITWPAALEGDDKARNTILRCIAQRSKLLGLEAPVQVAVSTREGEAVQVSVTHTLEPEVMAAARLIRERVVQASLARSGDVVDVIPPADPV